MTRRRVTTAVTLVVLAAVLAGMAVFGFRSLTAPFPHRSAASASASCSPQDQVTTRTLTRKEVQVSVFNAGTRSGQASNTLDMLVRAGFNAGDVGNAPATAKVRRSIVWTTKASDPAAKLVALALGRGTRIQVVRQALGPGVNVLVGNDFRKLDRRAPKQVKLGKPTTTCLKTG